MRGGRVALVQRVQTGKLVGFGGGDLKDLRTVAACSRENKRECATRGITAANKIMRYHPQC